MAWTGRLLGAAGRKEMEGRFLRSFNVAEAVVEEKDAF